MQIPFKKKLLDAVLVLDKACFKTNSINMVRESYYLMIQEQFTRETY